MSCVSRILRGDLESGVEWSDCLADSQWRDLRAPGLEEAALEVLAEAERLAAVAA